MKYKVLATENIFKNKFFDIEQVEKEIAATMEIPKKSSGIFFKSSASWPVYSLVEDTEVLAIRAIFLLLLGDKCWK